MAQSKKYICICKIGNNPDGSAKCIKHHVNNLLKYVEYLDKQWADWRWFNVFDKRTGGEIGSFTKSKRPLTKWV